MESIEKTTNSLPIATNKPCECVADCAANLSLPKEHQTSRTFRFFSLLAVAIAVWWFIYRQLEAIANWLVFTMLRLDAHTAFGSASQFFLYETPKVLMLLTLVVFGVGILRSFFTPERTRRVLEGKREITGNALAALLGVVTPFCSCSAVPLFIGFVTSGVPLGVTFSFLISAPMINEVALVLLFGLFGWHIAVIYAGMGLIIAFLSGWMIGRFKMEKHVEPWVYATPVKATSVAKIQGWPERFHSGAEAVREIVGKVWLFVIFGIAVGAGIHGYVPEHFLAHIMGKGAWWSVPVAILVGVPMYANAAGMIPIVQALLGKGAALGTVLAFMMSVIALSFPETIILRKVLRPRLIATFVGVVSTGILIVGFLFNWLM